MDVMIDAARILIVDDSPATREVLQRNLEVSQALEDERIARGVEFALLMQAEQEALAAAPGATEPSGSTGSTTG